jgi:hypothetical protein
VFSRNTTLRRIYGELGQYFWQHDEFGENDKHELAKRAAARF